MVNNNKIYLDAICFNMDRHTKNYGILRDVNSGMVFGLAPNFDNNIALISRRYLKNIERQNDKLIGLFAELSQKSTDAANYFAQIRHPEITESLIMECCKKVPIEVDSNYICSFITT